MRALLALLLSVPLIGAVAHPVEPVAYSLAPEVVDGALRALKVQVRFRVGRSGVVGFGWADGWGGDTALWRWSRDVSVSGGAGWLQDRNGHWRITAPPGAMLTVRYRIVSAYDHDPTVEDSEQAKPVIRPRWFYAVGDSLFGRPDDRDDAPARFTWTGAPRGFGFASDLQHLAGPGRKASRPGTVADVLESVVIGGSDLRLFPARDGSGVRVATVGRYAFDPEKLDTLARQVIGVERGFWGASPSAPFLVTVAPIIGTPTETSYGGTGRGDAFALWVDQLTSLDRMKWLLAHEYLHSWNPALLGRPAEGRAQRAKEFWFSEGVTDYHTRALLVRAGLISPDEFAIQWNQVLLAYAGSPVRNMKGDAAAAAFWTDEAAERLAYQRGAMLAVRWNAELRSTTGSGLDEVMRQQLAAARTSMASPVDLFRAMARWQGLDVSADIGRYVDRGETVTLAANAFGPCATVATERRPSYSRGFDPDATAKAGNVVTGVDRASPAYAAGLRDGMHIVARVAGEPDDALVEYALLVDDSGRRRTVRYLPQGKISLVVQQIHLLGGADCAATLSGQALRRS